MPRLHFIVTVSPENAQDVTNTIEALLSYIGDNVNVLSFEDFEIIPSHPAGEVSEIEASEPPRPADKYRSYE